METVSTALFVSKSYDMRDGYDNVKLNKHESLPSDLYKYITVSFIYFFKMLQD